MGTAKHKPRTSNGRQHPATTRTRARALTLDDVIPALRDTALSMTGGDRARIQVVRRSQVVISPR